MKRHRVQVSNNALVRYLELVGGENFDDIRAEIAEIVDPILEHDGVSGILSDGMRYVIEDRTVVTIHVARRPNVKTHRGR